MQHLQMPSRLLTTYEFKGPDYETEYSSGIKYMSTISEYGIK